MINQFKAHMREYHGSAVKVYYALVETEMCLPELVEVTGLSRNVVYSACQKLVQDGWIVKTDSIWAVPKTGTSKNKEVVTVQEVTGKIVPVPKKGTALIYITSTRYKEFRLELERAFIDKVVWSNYPAERKNLKQFIEKCVRIHAEDPELFAKGMMQEFWRATQGREKFWKDIPFLPRKLNALFDDVYKRFRDRVETSDVEADVMAKLEEAGI